VSEKFLDKGKLISYTQGRDPADRKEFHSSATPVLPRDIPLVVLVNSSTASASEIVAGALQDDHRAVIMGEPTYGKGLVQTLIPVDDEVNLKLTTAKWYTPSGRCIQREEPEEDEEALGEDELEEPKSTIEIDEKKEIETQKDKGGIAPDVVLEPQEHTRYAFELERQNQFFKFAVDYMQKHPTIPKDFRATPEIVGQFKSQLDAQKFTYETASEMELEKLREMTKLEGYDAGLAPSLEQFEKRIAEEKTKDFEKNREYIAYAIEREIMSKAYGTDGFYRVRLRNDPDTQAAIDLLRDTVKYRQTLDAKRVATATPSSKG
jgi:carboxyl-terminal processing protease